jgi:hypothetical protein
VLILASKFTFEALIDFVKAFSSVSKEDFKASRFWVTGSTSGLAAATNLAASANASAANWRLFFFELDVGDRVLLFVHVDAVVVLVLPNNLPPASRFAAGALVENGAGVAAGIVEPNKKVLAGGSIGVDAAVSVEVSISGFALVATGMDVAVPVVVPVTVEVPVVEFSLVATGMDASVSVEVSQVGFALVATAKGLEKSAPKLKPPTAGTVVVEVGVLSAGVLWGGALLDLSLFTAITNSRFSKNDFVDTP